MPPDFPPGNFQLQIWKNEARKKGKRMENCRGSEEKGKEENEEKNERKEKGKEENHKFKGKKD